MRNIIILAGICLFAFSSCRKEKMFPNTTINGTIKDSTTQQNLGGVQIELFRWKDVGSWTSNYKKINIQSTVTNDNGNWEIKFRQVHNRLYNITFDKDGYYPREYQIDETKTLEKEIEMIPKGSIELTLTNDTTNIYDEIYIEVINPYSTNVRISRCDDYLPETNVFDAIGNTYTKIQWTKYVNPDCIGTGSMGVTFTDSIWVGHNQTVLYEIKL